MTTNVLCIIPPYIPSYFNAGHHLPVFLVTSYLRKNYPQINIEVYDLAALNGSWKDVCDLLLKKYDVIYAMYDYDGADTCERFAYYVRNLSQNSHLVAFGRLVKEMPLYFLARGYDAAHASGDYECGAESYLKYYLKLDLSLDGLIIRNTIGDTNSRPAGQFLEPKDWVLPEVEEIPYAAYNNMYKNDLNKFCGIPNRQELVVPIARGCPVGCDFCDVHKMQGLKERRLSVDQTLFYIQSSFLKLPFEYFTFYAPTFTLDRKWVKEFCEKKINSNLSYKWKCVTVLQTMTIDLLNLMAESGCIRISFGIESFNGAVETELPRLKRDTWEHFSKICEAAKEKEVEINVFLIFGLPGDKPENMRHTIQTCLEQGIRVRPTIYTPYDKLNHEMTSIEVSAFNRQIFVDGTISSEDASDFYALFYNNKLDKSTKIMDKIDRHPVHHE